MYISGNQSDFQSRQHQLIDETGAYQSFFTEFNDYSGVMTPAWNKKSKREFEKAIYRISGVNTILN